MLALLTGVGQGAAAFDLVIDKVGVHYYVPSATQRFVSPDSDAGMARIYMAVHCRTQVTGPGGSLASNMVALSRD